MCDLLCSLARRLRACAQRRARLVVRNPALEPGHPEHRALVETVHELLVQNAGFLCRVRVIIFFDLLVALSQNFFKTCYHAAGAMLWFG